MKSSDLLSQLFHRGRHVAYPLELPFHILHCLREHTDMDQHGVKMERGVRGSVREGRGSRQPWGRRALDQM